MLSAGTRIGPYVIDREIGRGGMGVVCAGHDTRLDRPVAIKMLPPEFAADPTLAARLEREARALASLNHPNIAGVYGLEEQDGRRYLVMELVGGETLDRRLAAGRLPIPEALAVAAQVAGAIEAAHDRGVIHRDIKPGNIMLSADGTAKVLDFGLARDVPGSTAGVAASTVRVAPVTAEGRVVGTPGYMSPEQCRGKTLDKRTDVWSLGCVLYECLTGQMAFAGESATDAVAAILERDPDWTRLPERTPAGVRDLLRRCLVKDARQRLRDAGDARLELDEALAARAWSTASMRAASGSVRSKRWAWMAAGVVVGAAGFAAWWLGFAAARPGSGPVPAAPVTRLTIALPAEPRVTEHLAMSPDGRILAYIAVPSAGSPEPGRPRIYLRRLDSYDAASIPGTEGAYYLDFSPDGRWLTFVTRATETSSHTTLMKVQLSGGPPVTLYEQAEGELKLPTWFAPETIALLVGPGSRQVGLISSDGGDVRVVWDAAKAGSSERPQALYPVPGGRFLLMTLPIADTKGWRERTMLLSLATGEAPVLLDYGGYARYVAPGYLAYAQANAMLARPFDAQRGEFTGGAVPLVSGLRAGQSYSSYLWELSDAGNLAYVPGGNLSFKRHLALVDLKGKVEPLSKLTADFEASAAMSPDGKLVCGSIVSEGGTYELFLYDVAGDAVRRLPVRGDCTHPIWTPDSRSVVYGVINSTPAPETLVLRRVDRGDTTEVLVQSKGPGAYIQPTSISPDGKWVLYQYPRERAHPQMFLVSVDAPHEVRPLFEGAGELADAQFSPDGRWIACGTVDNGRGQISVRSNPLAPDAASRDGATAIIPALNAHGPLWTPDGAMLCFMEGRNRIMAVDVRTQPGLSISQPRDLFNRDAIDSASDIGGFTPDGKHLVFILMAEEEARISQINIVLNWADELRARMSGSAK